VADQSGTPVTCGNLDCKVAEDGKCVEGLPLERCPHYGRPPAADAPATTDEPESTVVSGVALPPGDLMNTADAASILRIGDTRVIAIIGPRGAGKTTLIASLYELFQLGPVGDSRFARSQTLYAFERACHHSRAVSLRGAPATERTIVKDVHFYHLGIRIGSAPILDLLLADRAGEEYRDATDDVSISRGFVEIGRADVITLLVDGKRLLDLASRHAVQSEIIMILQALIDGDAIAGRPRVAIALTKTDEVGASADNERVERDFDALAARIQQLFSAKFGPMRSFRVAACPADDTVARGQGVEELLDFWNEPATAPENQRLVPLAMPARLMSRLAPAEE